MKKSEIINFLSCTYCRIKESSIHGIGVHAIVDIKKNTNLFPDCSCDLNNMKAISKEEIPHLNAPTIKMMSDFFIETNTHYFTTTSLNTINISYFLNHSDEPNCKNVKGFWHQIPVCYLTTIKPIKPVATLGYFSNILKRK